MPHEWEKIALIPIYKNKGEIDDCKNYLGIRLMSCNWIVGDKSKHKLGHETNVSEN